MSANEIKPVDKSVCSYAALNQPLYDVRPGKRGLIFGTIESVCKQYGIECELIDDGKQKYHKFSAPKVRLQVFIEKLHFSRTPYFNKT